MTQKVPLSKVAPQNPAERLIGIELAKFEFEYNDLTNWA